MILNFAQECTLWTANDYMYSFISIFCCLFIDQNNKRVCTIYFPRRHWQSTLYRSIKKFIIHYVKENWRFSKIKSHLFFEYKISDALLIKLPPFFSRTGKNTLKINRPYGHTLWKIELILKNWKRKSIWKCKNFAMT